MALEVFSSIRYWIKPEDISIDNWIFKLHYRFSTAILLGSSAIGVAKQYFGDPINCQVMRFPKILKKQGGDRGRILGYFVLASGEHLSNDGQLT